MTTEHRGAPLGIVEATKGASWSSDERVLFVEHLAREGLAFYLLGSRPHLEHKSALVAFSRNSDKEISRLAPISRSTGLALGISAFFEEALVRSSRDISVIVESLKNADFIGDIKTLLLRFDGAPLLGRHLLADIQVEIVHAISSSFGSTMQIVVCPTLYADDVSEIGISDFERDRYRQALSQIGASVSIFWSGPTIMSDRISRGAVERVTEQYQRKPALWYNFPVNDGRGYESRLRLIPQIEDVQQTLGGFDMVAFNPMRQLRLSEIPIISAMRAIQSSGSDWSDITHTVCIETLGLDVGEVVWSNITRLDHRDRLWPSIDEAIGLALKGKKSPYALELRTWLDQAPST
ncbi:beta-N-acetylglucosaminidase domain-containing protein [Micromonospora sp. NBC_01638]|uniref:beta-N-acetylglucosaminidase domain-containing protein n=1 Tax=Micromonospora sp. NBC_01638 TaxID=2975982 RepID=UPI00386D9D57|nr:protein O-GlcNAcase [Micromonospora sp. NBC_01638]